MECTIEGRLNKGLYHYKELHLRKWKHHFTGLTLILNSNITPRDLF